MARLRSITILLCCAILFLLGGGSARATEYHGLVLASGVPVPGAVVTLTQGDKTFSAVTDRQGLYQFADIADGQWKIKIEMSGFAPVDNTVTVGPNAPESKWDLKLLGLDEMLAKAQMSTQLKSRPPSPPAAAASGEKPKTADQNVPPAPAPMPPEEAAEKSSDGMLINGSESNAATSQYSLSSAIGNRRPGQRGLYNGGVGAIIDNSALDARPFSLTGVQLPKENYSTITGLATLGGPLRIPRLLPYGPNFFVAYQWTRSATATNQTGLVPSTAERSGDLSGLTNTQGQPVTIYNPSTGLPFTGRIPVNPQAAALLNLYPLPNVTGKTQYNYQAEVLNNTHIDRMQSRLMKNIGRRDQLYGGIGFQSTRANNTDLFGFTDGTNSLGIDTNINWSHRYHHQTFVLLTYHFTRLRTEMVPQFEGRQNISEQAGITGNAQDVTNWGPPGMSFSDGTAGLGDGNSAFNRNRTDALTVNVSQTIRRHNLNIGGDFRRQEFNEYGQQNPRGTFTFTGAATQQGGSAASGTAITTGSALADFLMGVPDTSAISFGNPDKYFRQSVYDLYFNDDWRVLPELTIDAGVRWDYGAPLTELKGRLVNLDVGSGFSSAATVSPANSKGAVTGASYPSSLVRPDKRGFEPRIGISWRPIPASTLVVRAGYGIYYDTSVYLTAAQAMATQAPLATNETEANSSACPLTLANGFRNCATAATDTFAIDPNFRVGYAQNWQASVQRDLPWALVATVTYLGTKGTHGMQQFLPNTYPIGAANPCPLCEKGFVYRTSGGNSLRNAGQLQLRRRLRSGLTATLDYTYSKALDDDAQLGGQGHTSPTAALSPSVPGPAATVAQNWLDLEGERGLSTFDQRQLLSAQVQYTTGMGIGAHELMSGWSGRLLKEWTVTTQINYGSGLPESPIYLAAIPGTGWTNVIRPNLTGAPIYGGAPGYHLNSAAYAPPTLGGWGDARRDSITGPDTFTLNGAMARTLRLRNPFNLDVRIDATNMLNTVVYSGWNTVVNSTTFGLPSAANGMRSLQITTRLRF